MSNASFEDRIRRLNAKSPQLQPAHSSGPNAGPTRTSKSGLPKLIIGALFLSVGGKVLKNTNENYEAIRDGSGIETAVGYSLAGLAVFCIGIIVVVRGLFASRRRRKSFGAPGATSAEQARRKASGKARFVASSLGFTFGVGACVALFLSAMVAPIDTEVARHFFRNASLILLLLIFVTTLIGFVGIFLRGYALGRVPLYFLFGALIAFSALRISGVGLSELEPFLPALQ